ACSGGVLGGRARGLDERRRVGHSRPSRAVARKDPGRNRQGEHPMNMDIQHIIAWVVIGIVAGWLAGLVVGGDGGILRDLITGIIGAFVGGLIFSSAGWKLNLGNPWIEQIVVAAIGAIVVVILARIIA